MVVKVCGNKSIDDARKCIDSNVDIIGLLVGKNHNSDDFISKELAREIVLFVNGMCDVSLVTHLTNSKDIIELTKYIGNNVIQLHSNIIESEVQKIVNELPNTKLVRVIHISKHGRVLTDYKKIKYADFYLLDSINTETNQVGGTGLTHNWEKSKELIKKLNKPTFLAGGLTPDNVEFAIKSTNPYGVDVNSGCKDKYDFKDKEKIKKFIKNAKL